MELSPPRGPRPYRDTPLSTHQVAETRANPTHSVASIMPMLNDSSALAFCREVLPAVSRTFALNIPVLHGNSRIFLSLIGHPPGARKYGCAECYMGCICPSAMGCAGRRDG